MDRPEQNVSQTRQPTSKDLNVAVEGIMSQISSLATLYQHETDALMRADTDAFSSVQAQKEQEAAQYEMQMQSLLQHKSEMSNLAPEIKEKLKAMQAEFSALMQENAMALSRMQGSAKRMNDLIINATRRAVQNEMAVSYGEGGRLHTAERKRLTTGQISKTA